MKPRAFKALSWTAAVIVLSCGRVDALAAPTGVQTSPLASSPDEGSWKAGRAMNDIQQLLLFTPRSMGRRGHAQTVHYIEQQLLAAKNTKIEFQQWQAVGDDARRFAMTNIVARLDPANPNRVIVGTHYDSIVTAYADQKDPTAPMPGANNSASGVALLLETVRALGRKPSLQVGVDFVFFDGEEGIRSLGAGDPNWAAVGSPYFASHLRDLYPARLPQSGAIFDMVCFKNLRLHPEPSSLESAHAEVQKFWQIGEQVAPTVFVSDPKQYPISDDHTALIAAGVPSFLVIDFDYAPWFNTTQDTIGKCSSKSLQVVGRTLLRYLHANR